MKTIITFSFAVLLSFMSCHAQNKEKSTKKTVTSAAVEPKGTWKVSKEIDKDGNLIRYDSIHSYSYDNVNGREMSAAEMQKALSDFENYMQNKMPASFSKNILFPMNKDSIYNNFMERGFYENHWQDFFPEMQSQLKHMDSIHEEFFKGRE